jgi:hypothetical protein
LPVCKIPPWTAKITQNAGVVEGILQSFARTCAQTVGGNHDG